MASSLLRTPVPQSLPFWALIRRFKQQRTRRFEAAVTAEVGRRADEVASEAVSRIDRSRKRHEEALAARRAERDWKGFAPIAVSLRGFKSQDGDEHYVLIELNRKTGQLRPAKARFRQILSRKPSTDSNGWFSGGGWENDRLFSFSELGCPTWSKIDGEPLAIVLLGEVYRYSGEHRVTGIESY